MRKDIEVVPALEAYGTKNATYFSQKIDWCGVDVGGMELVDFALSENRRISLLAQKDGKGYIIDEKLDVYQIFTYEEILEAAEKITAILDEFINPEYEAETYINYIAFAKKFLETAEKIDTEIARRETEAAKEAAEKEKKLRLHSAG